MGRHKWLSFVLIIFGITLLLVSSYIRFILVICVGSASPVSASRMPFLVTTKYKKKDFVRFVGKAYGAYSMQEDWESWHSFF